MFVLFFAVWVLLNGRLDLEVAAFGLVITGAIYWFCCKFMHYGLRRDLDTLKRLPRFFSLLLTLVAEVFKAAFDLLPYIYGGKKPDPVVAQFKMDRVKTDTGRVFLANCITMTPGTITGSLKDGVYLVHCLDRTMAEGLADSSFVDKLERWEA